MRALLVLSTIGSMLLAAGCVEEIDTSDNTTTTSTPTETASPVSVTIENTTSAPIFVRAGLDLPFAVSQAGQDFTLRTDCSCAVCGSGHSCMVIDALSAVVEIGAGDSITVDMDLSWYVAKDVPGTCSEASGWETCGQPSAFAAGDYELRVEYGVEQAMVDQGLTISGNKQWGHPVWTGGLFVAIDLAGSEKQTFTPGAGTTTLQVQIGD